MYKGNKVIITVCARGRSKSLPNKNILPLLGKPLIWHTLNFAQQVKWVDRIIVSTDDPEIRDLALKFGVPAPFLRPKELASDTVGKAPAILHAIDYAQTAWKEIYDISIDLAITSPIRTQDDINNSIELLLKPKTTMVLSGYSAQENPYFNMVEINSNGFIRLSKKTERPIERRQDTPPVYTLNGNIYTAWTKSLFKSKSYLTSQTRLYIMPRDRSFDLDNEIDFKFLEFFLSHQDNNQHETI